MKRIALITFCLVSIFITTTQPTLAISSPGTCANVDLIFARGSGQTLGDDAREATRFFKQIEAKIPATHITTSKYELGTQFYSNHKYPAVDITWGSLPNTTGVGAKLSAGKAFQYGKSVSEGTLELLGYLTERHSQCPETRFILGGYSQGAQVVGQRLSLIPSSIRNNIDFVALFGDPKLYLPEGEGLNPPACRGENLSQWRRTIGDCNTDNGSLGSRNPYLPEDMKSKTGLWCNEDDYICGTSKNALVNAGHGQYRNLHGAIDRSIQEIIIRLRGSLPSYLAQYLHDDQEIGVGAGVDENIPNTPTTPKQMRDPLDVAIIVEAPINLQTMLETSTFASKVIAQGGRIALASYRANEPSVLHSNFQPSMSGFSEHLQTLYGSSTTEPKNLLSSLTSTFNAASWQPGAQKAAVVVAGASFPISNPDGSTIKTVADLALKIDPVNIYPILPKNTSPTIKQSYAQLAEHTSGKVTSLSTTSSSFSKVLSEITTRPVAKLKIPNYYAKPGQAITFDASNSYVANSTITRYDWDFDGDGSFEQSTISPSATHVYENNFDGVMQVRLSAANSTIANASAPVIVNPVSPFTKSPPPPTDIQLLTSGDSVVLSWTDDSADKWVISVNDFPIGTTTANSVKITDFQPEEKTTFSVAAVTASAIAGSPATIEKQPEPSSTERGDILSSSIKPEVLGNHIDAQPPQSRPSVPSATIWIVVGSSIFIALAYLVAKKRTKAK